HEIGERSRRVPNLALDEVLDDELALGHREPERVGATLGFEGRALAFGQTAAPAVVARRLASRHRRPPPLLQLLWGAVAAVGVPLGNQPLGDLVVDLGSLRL